MAMPRTPRFFPDEEELSKKDDDHRPPQTPGRSSSWKPAAPRYRKRRLLAFIGALGFLYVFFKNMPQGLPPIPDRFDRRVPGQRISGIPLKGGPISHSGHPLQPSQPKTQRPPPPSKGNAPEAQEEADTPAGHIYDGPVSFESLSTSLQGLARSLRFSSHNRNVLFAAANLESASRMIPLACEMSRWNRNVVHFAYMGRDKVPLLNLRYLNGVGVGCEVYWHGKEAYLHS